VLVVFLLLWQFGPGWLGMPEFVLPPLTKVAEEAVRIWHTERLLWHAGITALEVVIGFVLGSAMGALIGYALGVSPGSRPSCRPTCWRCRSRPRSRSRRCS
jgi:NitT/TauT family transport system permease protein